MLTDTHLKNPWRHVRVRPAYRSDALRDGGHEVEEEVRDEVVRSVRSSIHRPDNVAHLLLEVPLERQRVEVGE